MDELIAKFDGAKFFTIVDMDKGHWQVVLDPESRKYTTMALDIGRFQWKRMPIGTAVASDIFQRKLDSAYIGLPGVTGIAVIMDMKFPEDKETMQSFLGLLNFLNRYSSNIARLSSPLRN